MSKNEEYSFMKSSPTRIKKQEENKQRNSQATNNYDDLMQSVMQIGYRFGKWSTFKSIELKQDEPAWILGKEFTPKRIHDQQEEGLFSLNPEESKRERAAEQIKIEEQMKNDRVSKSEKMLQIYTNTLLFTYRKNFMYLLHDFPDDPLNKKYTSDYGWGCMIRTGQMILAEALKKHLKKKDYVEPHNLSNIILGFCENEGKERKPYSIHEVARLAFKKYQIYPGKWYTPVLICYVLRDLHKARKVKGSENLKIFVSGSDKPMVFEKLLAKMLGSNKKLNQIKSQVCQHQKSPRISNLERRRSFSNDSYEKIGPFNCSKKKGIIDEDEDDYQDRADNVDEVDDKSELVCTQCAESVNSLLLLIPSKLGVDEINESHKQIIKRFLSSPYSVGMIGGRPSKAHYFLGYIGNELLYLDPHWIQETFSRDQIMDHLQTFFSKEVHKISLSKISSSLAFGFLFQNLGELNAFYASLRQLEREYGDDFFLVIEREYPSYAQSSEKELTKLADRYQRQTDKQERKLKQQKRKEDTKNKVECSLIQEMKEDFEEYDDASSYRDSEESNSNSSNNSDSDSQSDRDENLKKIREDVEQHQPSALDLENDQIEAEEEENGGSAGSGNLSQKKLMNICGDKRKMGILKFYENEDDFDIS